LAAEPESAINSRNMKKNIAFLIVLAALLCSCKIDEAESRRADYRTRQENNYIMRHDVVDPVTLLYESILIDEYLSATEEEQASEKYSSMRQKLYQGEAGVYKMINYGTVETGQKSVRAAGTVWKLTPSFFDEVDWFEFQDVVEIECVKDALEWSIREGNAVKLNVTFNSDSTFNATMEGHRTSTDGYDLSMKTDGPMLVYEYIDAPIMLAKGRLVHTVSSGGTILDKCVGSYDGTNHNYQISR